MMPQARTTPRLGMRELENLQQIQHSTVNIEWNGAILFSDKTKSGTVFHCRHFLC